MTKVIYGENPKEISKMQGSLDFIHALLEDDDATDECDDKLLLNAKRFVESIRFDISAEGILDTALIGEIGKAYKGQYDLAVEAGNDIMKERMHGAMFAIKKIMEMVKDQSV